MKADNSSIQKVVCLVFYRDGKILLEQRLDKDAFHENWMFTGGKVEKKDYEHKDPVHAASVREAKEETRLGIIKTNIFTTFTQELRDGRIFEFIGVHVDKWEGELFNRETHRRKLAWIGINKAETIIGEHEVDKRILNNFRHYIVKK